MRISTLSVVALFSIVGITQVSQADLLDIASGNPDVYSGTIDIQYNATGGGGEAGLFTANGRPRRIDYGGGTVTDIPSASTVKGDFHVDAIIQYNPTTGAPIAVTSASVLIIADIDPGSPGKEILYSSSTIAGFKSLAEDKFEFLFANPTGVLATLDWLRITMDGQSIDAFSTPVYNANFAGDKLAVADTFQVAPEPTSLALLAVGGVLAAWRRRKR